MQNIVFKNNESGIKQIFGNESRNYQEIKEIPIADIRFNQLNDMKDSKEMIEVFAENIHNTSQGVLDIIVVYANDDNTYTLLSGERRLRASQLNLKKYGSPKALLAKIVDKPKNMTDELDFLLKYNEYRRFETDEEKIRHVEKYKKLYEMKVNEGQHLGKKREWIAKRSGIGIQKVGMILQYLDGKKDCVKTTRRKNKNQFLDLSRSIEHILDTKVRVDDKKITIYFDGSIGCNDLLEKLGILDKLHDMGY